MKHLINMLVVALAFLMLAGCLHASPVQMSASPFPGDTQETETIDGQTVEPTPAPTPPATVSPPPAESPEPSVEPLSRDVLLQLKPAYPNITFDKPVEYRVSGDDSGNVYVVEKGGKILVFSNRPDVESADVFLDLTGLVDSSASEKGLLGLAFHPNYKNNGFFFVNYTGKSGTVIARYMVDPEDPMRALSDSAETILSYTQPYNNHNGGQIDFGPDGYLYIASGDGGSAGDPKNNAQNLNSLLGKMLRIDVDRPDEGMAYGIPRGNPFYLNDKGYRQEIYAYGLRNPWKFSFDLRTGLLWAADVGQDKFEEINIIESGKNYGWKIMEGNAPYSNQNQNIDDDLASPVWVYEHPVGNSITGGYVYYGDAIPALKGAYIYGDFGTGLIWALWLDDSLAPDNRLLLETDLKISSFGLDENGELYILDYLGAIYTLFEVITSD